MLKHGLQVFIGGPTHDCHTKLAERLQADSQSRSFIRSARAFDDSEIRDTSSGPTTWIEYLKLSDVAIFIFPSDVQQHRSTVGSYTLEEIRIAEQSGILTYFITEKTDGQDNLLLSEANALCWDSFKANEIDTVELDEDKLDTLFVKIHALLMSARESIQQYRDEVLSATRNLEGRIRRSKGHVVEDFKTFDAKRSVHVGPSELDPLGDYLEI